MRAASRRAGAQLGDGSINTAISLGTASPALALDAVSRAAEAAGFPVKRTARDALRVAHRVRPRWCNVAGRLLAVPTLGSSLLLLKVRTLRFATVLLTDGPSGPHVRLSGDVPESLPAVIVRALTDMQATAPERPVTPPHYASLDQAIRAERTVAIPVEQDVNATVARPRRLDLTPNAPRLKFDSGVTVTVQGHALIGRAPVPEADERRSQLLPIPDPGLSVSKTHLAVGVDEQGFWVCDRYSTNGSAITGPDGVKVPCVPGERHYVKSGSTVHMGERSFAVVLSERPVAQSR